MDNYKEQMAVVINRMKRGYHAQWCRYLGRDNRVFLTNGDHMMVINPMGYDEFVKGYYPTNLVDF